MSILCLVLHVSCVYDYVLKLLSDFFGTRSGFFSEVGIPAAGQHDTLRLSCYDANWREHAESKAIEIRMPCPHTL